MVKAFNLRIPEGLKLQLAAAAAANHRSLNAEILQRLLRSFGGGYQR
jgi:predicted HicB family RNase H-like nuclease